MQYRPEVDGLRAVAVLPVILFHAGLPRFSGGFVGVDVFFVISGYLITTLILEDLDAGRFSLLRFYDRRARRILPALFCVMLCSVPFAWMWLLPEDFRNFSQSLVATIFFSSNVLFWTESGYFSSASELKPLLHTWSLAVEEQYYILFPLTLLLIWRLGRRWIFPLLAMLCLASLVAGQWAAQGHPAAAFYLLPFRGWELLVGALTALFLRSDPLLRRGPRQFGSALGLGLICFAVLRFDGDTPVPGVWLLVPTLGTALVLVCARSDTAVGGLMRMRPLVGLGLISYSAYLWHQPVFAFAHHRSFTEPDTGTMLALAGLAVAMAALTWRFIEQPFRRGAPLLHPVPRVVIHPLTAAACVLVAVGFAGHLNDGFPGRLSTEARKLAGFSQDESPLRAACHFGPGRAFPADRLLPACLTPGANGKADVLLVGDSHALSIAAPVQALLGARGIGSYAISYSGCIGLRGFDRPYLGQSYDCLAFNEAVIALARSYGIGTVVVTSRFPLYVTGEWFDNGGGGREPALGQARVEWVASAAATTAPADTGAQLLDAFEAELQRLSRQFHVVIVLPIPEVGWDVPRLLAKHDLFGPATPPPHATSYEVYARRSDPVSQRFRRLASDRIAIVETADVFCDVALGCRFALDGVPLYRDDDHLAHSTGARMLAEQVVAAVLGTQATRD